MLPRIRDDDVADVLDSLGPRAKASPHQVEPPEAIPPVPAARSKRFARV